MRLGLLPLWLVTALFACDSHPATQVVVHFHAASGLRTEAEAIHVRVEGPEGSVAYDEENPPSAGAGALARVPLVPRDGDASRTFRITGTLLDGAGAELARVEAVASYVEDELREIHLWFDEDCRGVTDCGPGRTCDRGICVGACFVPSPPGEVARSEPTCTECEECLGGSCVALAERTPCGCPGTDTCIGGSCVTMRPVAEVYGGHLHTCAGVRDGDVYCWGSDRVGQLGTGGGSTPEPTALGFGSHATGTAATDHTCWITIGGQRRCWGWGTVSSVSARSSPWRTTLPPRRPTAIRAGRRSTLAGTSIAG